MRSGNVAVEASSIATEPPLGSRQIRRAAACMPSMAHVPLCNEPCPRHTAAERRRHSAGRPRTCPGLGYCSIQVAQIIAQNNKNSVTGGGGRRCGDAGAFLARCGPCRRRATAAPGARQPEAARAAALPPVRFAPVRMQFAKRLANCSKPAAAYSTSLGVLLLLSAKAWPLQPTDRLWLPPESVTSFATICRQLLVRLLPFELLIVCLGK